MCASFRCRPERSAASGRRRAFTLLELLVTLAVLALILVGLMTVLNIADQCFRSAAQDPFADAAEAFDSVCDRISQATLAGYQDYVDANGAFRPAGSTTFVPDHVTRRSDLAFVTAPCGDLLAATFPHASGDAIFFVAPAGITQTCSHQGVGSLLNALGYFVAFGNTSGTPDFVTASRWRWRLEQVAQPSESLGIYQPGTATAWASAAAGGAAPLADDVILLVTLPERPATSTFGPVSTDFRYDSRDTASGVTRDQLPARVQVVLAAIDEASAARLAVQNGTQPPPLVPSGLFQSAAQLDNDVLSLEAALTQQKITHRIFRRDVALVAAAWTETSAP
jgi:uncharacterized protein (TIGR02599 family)